MVGRLSDEIEQAFATWAGSLDYPMFIVTTVGAAGERSGCLVGFSTQCSIHPPRYLVGLSVKNHTAGVAATATHFAVHAVPRRERELAALFGEATGDEIDKFERCAWTLGPGGVPLLDACPARFVGRVLERVSALGDHTGYVLEPVAADGDAGDFLRFSDTRDLDPGHDA